MSTQTIDRPRQEDFAPVEEAGTIEAALKNVNVIRRFQQIVPKHLNPERMVRVCALAVYKTPLLAKCETMSLLGAMLSLADLGLEPNTPLQHAFLIPFKSRRKTPGGAWEDYYQVQVVIGYRGYLDLAYRTGMLTSCHADVVYAPDTWSFEYGTNRHLKHIPSETGDRSKPVWAYCHVGLTDGDAFEVLPYKLVLAIRDKAQSYVRALDQGRDSNAFKTCPWVAYEHEMSQKTMIRRIAKNLHQSVEFARAMEIDDLGEAGTINFAEVARSQERIEYAPSMPFEPPAPRAETQEPETVAARAQPRRQPPQAPSDPAQPSEPTPKPRPPVPAEAPSPSKVEPEYAFTLISADGEVLPYDDINDFRSAYVRHLTEAVRDYGADGGRGFIESNSTASLAWSLMNGAQVPDLEKEVQAVLDHTRPPADPTKRELF